MYASATLPRDHRVVGRDVRGTHDALHAHVFAASVDRHEFLSAHQQVAVREALGDRHADLAIERIALLARAIAGEAGFIVHRAFEDRHAIDGHGSAEHLGTGERGFTRLVGGGARGFLRAGVFFQPDGERVTDVARGDVLPQRHFRSLRVDGAGGGLRHLRFVGPGRLRIRGRPLPASWRSRS